MAVKQGYKIPADLNQSYANMEIALQKDGAGLKPLPIKVILSYVLSILSCFYICMNSVVSRGSALQIVLFVLLWGAMTVLLISYDTTRQMQIQLLSALFNYLPKTARHVMTRRNCSATGFYSIAGIDSIDVNGCIRYADGTYAYWYRVVGSASVLLFEDDRNAILQRVDAFYRKIGSDVEIIYVTAKESQKVYRQVASLKRKYDRLSVKDDDLKYIANERFGLLKNYVGKQFKSIHQYMVLKADNMEALTVAKNVLQSEVENSSLMLKQCVALYHSDVNEVLIPIYQDVTSRGGGGQ